jgi:hypothetical protein
MSHWDVFNGDADGICALQQLRLALPRAATLVTGVKRDIALLARVCAQAGDTVTVLDVSLDRNRGALLPLLERGVDVEYVDHHFAGELPAHPRLRLTIDPAPGTCTSLLVDRLLAGRYRPWAVVGAFGDNQPQAAHALARELGLREGAIEALRSLGEAMNYNAYGDSVADLFIAPDALYRALHPYADPLEFLGKEDLGRELSVRQAQDLACADAEAVRRVAGGASVHVLPDAAWARRVLGAYGNALSQREPGIAHAVLREKGGEAYVVSVRAPRSDPRGADALCRRFGGNGRAASAGIDLLPREEIERFVADLERAYPG